VKNIVHDTPPLLSTYNLIYESFIRTDGATETI